MWPFKSHSPEYRATRKELWRKFYGTETRDGARTVSQALALQPKFPDLSSGELIRLAYWGVSGARPDNDEAALNEQPRTSERPQ